MLTEKKNEIPAEEKKPKKTRTFSDKLDVSIIVMIVGLFLAIVCIFFVNFIIEPEIKWKEVGIDTVLISVCTVSIYILLRIYAQRKGRKTDEWRESFGRLHGKGERVIEGNYSPYALPYCRAWEEERLDSERKAVLTEAGLTLEEFKEKYCEHKGKELKETFPKLTKYQLKTVRRAQRIKRIRYNERYLAVNAGERRRRAPSDENNTKRVNRFEIARILLTTFAFTFFTASLLREITIEFSWEAVIRCVIKVATIIFFGAIGMVSGYNFATVKEVQEMNSKSDELDNFMKWVDKNRKTAAGTD